jgi:hypothetical protein
MTNTDLITLVSERTSYQRDRAHHQDTILMVALTVVRRREDRGDPWL